MDEKEALKEQKLKEKMEKKENKKKRKEELKKVKVESKNRKDEIKGKNTIKKKMDTDKIVIFSIVGVVVLIAAIIFGYFYFKTNVEAIATFDGGKLTKSEYTTYYKIYAMMLTQYGYPEYMIPDQIATKAAIDKMLLIEAKNAGIGISEEDMAKVNETFSDEEEIAAIKQNGLDVAQMKELYINEYTINSYIEYLTDKLSDDEVLEYIKSTFGENVDMNEYNTSHILFRVSSSATDEEKEQIRLKAEAILSRALQGEDFATLATENSEDTGTAQNGGKFTMYMDGNVLEEYVNAVKELSVGSIYGSLVKTDAGYHIIKLDSIVEGGRINNESERGDLVDDRLNNLAVTKNLKTNTNVLNKLVESITGKPVQTEEEYYESINNNSTSSDDSVSE